MKNWKNIAFIATVIIVITLPLAILKKTNSDYGDSTSNAYLGSESCRECHEMEFASWMQSDHQKAMAIATDETVLGDFDNCEFTNGDKVHKFYKRDGEFFVYTQGENGEWQELQITHTFGYKPLQQYLIPFSNGKYQCLPLAWDTENKKWFNLSEETYHEEIKPDDWLYWTNQAQNWNGMCAECHSTNLKKNYIAQADSFSTTFSEINVGCEACHGPGADHIKWARLPESSRPVKENAWLQVQTRSVNNEQFIDVCARCHSRRSQFTDFDPGFEHMYDYMQPTLLSEEYFPDGQILDEDYVYGSFLQSKMYRHGVSCNDCHDVHSGKRYFEDNRLCFQCHQQNFYGSVQHHFHKSTDETQSDYFIDGRKATPGEGSLCINCHMPGKYYMSKDFRNDHSLRIPRPDLSLEIGTPNACNQCHTDKSIEWSVNNIKKWYGESRPPHYGTVFAKAREVDPNVEDDLINLINDTLNSKIVRATALQLMSNYYSPKKQSTILTYLDDTHPMLRLAALTSYSSNNPEEFMNDVGPMLNDPVRAIRAQAAFLFSRIPKASIPVKYQEMLQKGLEEYKDNSNYSADFPGGRFNLGVLNSNIGNLQEAKTFYEDAIRIDAQFYPAKLNLAIVYNQLGMNKKAEIIYLDVLKNHPEIDGINYYLGLLLAEEEKYDKAAGYMLSAIKEDPDNPRINYNLGLIYQKSGNVPLAQSQFNQAKDKDPRNFDYGYALAILYLNNNQNRQFKAELKDLEEKFPNRPELVQLKNYGN